MLTASKYEAIICMLRGGATDDSVMKSQGISENTLQRVKKSNGSYDEYKKLHSAHLKKVKQRENETCCQEPQIIEHRSTVKIEATHYMMQEMQETNKLLKLISNKLAFIVEELTGKEASLDDKG